MVKLHLVSACDFYSKDVKSKTISKKQASFCLILTLNNLKNSGLCVFHMQKMEQHLYYCWEQSNDKNKE